MENIFNLNQVSLKDIAKIGGNNAGIGTFSLTPDAIIPTIYRLTGRD